MAKQSAAGNDDNVTTTTIERFVDWHAVTNWGTYLEQAGLTQADVQQASDVLGDGFQVYSGKEGKTNLVNVPMLVADWSFFVGDFVDAEGNKGEAVFVRGITREGKKVAFTDGGSGIYQTLRQYTDRTGLTTGPILTNGLVRNDFNTTDEKGNDIVGTVFRFDVRPYTP